MLHLSQCNSLQNPIIITLREIQNISNHCNKYLNPHSKFQSANNSGDLNASKLKVKSTEVHTAEALPSAEDKLLKFKDVKLSHGKV
jgi:hypothetical protein